MTADELDLVETDDLLEAIKRRSKHCGLILQLDRGGPGHDNLKWLWRGEHMTVLGLLDRLKRDVLDTYLDEAEADSDGSGA